MSKYAAVPGGVLDRATYWGLPATRGLIRRKRRERIAGIDPMFDSPLIRFAALLLTLAALALFAGSLAVALGADVPVISGWVEGQQKQERHESQQQR